MKKILTLTTLVLSVTLGNLARANDTVKVAELSGVTKEVSKVDLMSDGNLVITTTDHRVIEKTIAVANFQRLQGFAMQLSDAKIKHETHDIVCMMMMVGPRATLQVSGFNYNQNVNGFDGNLKTVWMQPGCAYHDSVLPTDVYQLQAAEHLQEVLRVLATEVVAE